MSFAKFMCNSKFSRPYLNFN